MMYESSGYDEQSSSQPSYMRGCIQGIQPVFYINGDVKFAGKKVLFNQKRNKDFVSCMDEITQRLNPAFGAVRNIYTPQGGHKIRSLTDFNASGKYVAAGIESFKRFEYTSIDPRPRPRKPINYNDIPPVYHTKRQVSGRIKRAQTQSIIIKCWSNGEDINEAHRILLTPWMQRQWTHVLNACTECLGTELNGAVYKLYTRDGYPIEKLEELEHGGRYVAVPAFKSFKRVDYKDTGMKNLLTSPRMDGRFRSLPPLSRDSKNSTNQSSPVHSQPASENGYAYNKRSRRNNHHPKREEDAVFPAKPIAHKRSSERNRRTQEVNYDKDEGGVFKSKHKNHETKGAEEVKESRDTKVDLPIDQVNAEEVKDENVRDDKGSGNYGRNDQARNSRNGTQQRNTVAKTNSKRNTQPPPKQAKDEDRNNGRPDRRETRSQKDDDRKRREEEQRSKEAKDRSDARERERREAKERSDQREKEKREAKERSEQRERERKEKEKSAKSQSKAKSPSNKNNIKSGKSTTSGKSTEQEKDEDEAARKIQHHYRGYRSRQQNKQETKQRDDDRYEDRDKERDPSPPRWEDRDSVNDRIKEDQAAAKIQAGVRGYQTRKRLKNERERAHDSPPPRKTTPPRETTPPQRQITPHQRETTPVKDTRSREDEAAAKIQAGYRGYKTRKDLKSKKEQERSRTPLENNNVSKTYNREDLENQAAAKIQAGYRGYKVRKDLKA